MKTKKMGTYKKLVLILLAGAAIGGAGGAVLGACVEIFGPGIAAGAEDMPDMMGVLQQVMLPLIVGIGAAGILIGEYSIWKLKDIGENIAGADDEMCDLLEYQYERTGAFGMKANIITQALCILALSVGYSMKYIRTEASQNNHFLLVCILFMLYFAYTGFWQARYVKCIQRVYPEKKGDPSSRKFQKEWLASCDEAERSVIYQSAYRSYVTANRALPLLLVVAMLGHLLFDTGVMAVALLASAWLIVLISYLNSCVKIRKEKLG